MTACLILTALGALVLCFYIREKIRSYSLKAVLLKTLVSVIFIAVAVCAAEHAPAGGQSRLAPFVILGLVFSLLGDIWLDLKYVYPAQDDIYTFAGFAVFGAAHALYIIGLSKQFYIQGSLGYALIPLALGVLTGLGNIILEKPMKLKFGKMKNTVFAYGVLLFSDLFIAGGLAILHGFSQPALDLFFIGLVLFTLSDLVLSGTYFGEGKDRPVDIILNYLFYYGGQYLIALSLLFVR
ncbi:MAG: hypothetical protein IJM42_01245 [Synergistes sp.]|nr:hypothetical protein [Synergistes sp.]